jgi:hypothetical protein
MRFHGTLVRIDEAATFQWKVAGPSLKRKDWEPYAKLHMAEEIDVKDREKLPKIEGLVCEQSLRRIPVLTDNQ